MYYVYVYRQGTGGAGDSADEHKVCFPNTFKTSSFTDLTVSMATTFKVGC